MSYLKANKSIEGFDTLKLKVSDTDFGHCAIDGPGYVKLSKDILKNGLEYPLILYNGTVCYGNKRLLYAKVNDYEFIDGISIIDAKELEKVRVLTCWKRN